MSMYYNNGGGFFSNIPSVTKNLLAINCIFFLATLLNEGYMVEKFAMFYPASRFFHPWQVITHMFMHGGVWHILFNMYSLLMFGSLLERTLGEKKFLVYYMLTGLGAAALHTGAQYLDALRYLSGPTPNLTAYYDILRTPVLGASGAIYGLLVGYAVLYPDSVLTLIFPPVSLKAKWFVIIFAAIEFLSSFRGFDGVAHFAHLGGLLFGWLILRWWKKSGRIYERHKWF